MGSTAKLEKSGIQYKLNMNKPHFLSLYSSILYGQRNDYAVYRQDSQRFKKKKKQFSYKLLDIEYVVLYKILWARGYEVYSAIRNLLSALKEFIV